MAYTTIDDPSAHFQIALYTGQGDTATAVTNDGNSDLQPDLIFFKSRSTTARWNVMDSTRGTTKVLYSDGNDAEATDAGSEKPLDSFNSDGFTAGESLDHHTNIDGASMIAFQWKANGGTRTTNTESGNNPAGGYQANTTAGFSIVDYTGTGGAGTMAHGLGVVPQMIIVKERDNAQSWYIYHHTLGNNAELYLNTNEASASPAKWNSTTPTSSVFSLAANDSVNQDATGYIAYCFAPIQGYSKFGTYEGNGNADGPYIYTGFKPAFVIIKEADNANDWDLRDNARDPFGPVDTWLRPNTTDSDGDSDLIDLLSNGFKIRQTSNRTNRSGGTLIYAAFAEQPFVSSEGVPCTAG